VKHTVFNVSRSLATLFRLSAVVIQPVSGCYLGYVEMQFTLNCVAIQAELTPNSVSVAKAVKQGEIQAAESQRLSKYPQILKIPDKSFLGRKFSNLSEDKLGFRS